jgi:hypothetical protein
VGSLTLQREPATSGAISAKMDFVRSGKFRRRWSIATAKLNSADRNA